jgi:cytochrome c-type biogenesis protein CcmE
LSALAFDRRTGTLGASIAGPSFAIEVAGAGTSNAARGKSMGPTVKIVLSLLVIGGAAAYLLASTMATGDSLTYFHTVDEVVVKPHAFKGQKIRVGGFVQKGSIIQKKGTLEYRFEVRPVEEMIKHAEARGKTLTVAYTGIVPDTFKDDAQVIVGGTVADDGSFVAKDLVAKCPSKYEAAEKQKGSY